MQELKTLPYVAKSLFMEKSHPFNWVGMESTSVALTSQINSMISQIVSFRASVNVSLDNAAEKWIQMLRLHALLNQLD